MLNGAWLRFSGRAARIHSHFGEMPTNHQLGLLHLATIHPRTTCTTGTKWAVAARCH